ncbi:Colicin-E2 immunity protein [Klebsiella pneumoniae]|nr:Colicin-E2 immunity protein [Klebsiella pneumoniae]
MDVDNIKALTPKIILRHIKENKMAGNKISDFTEEEFTAFVSKIIAADFPTDKENDDAIYSFAQLTEHPAGWNLIFKLR